MSKKWTNCGGHYQLQMLMWHHVSRLTFWPFLCLTAAYQHYLVSSTQYELSDLTWQNRSKLHREEEYLSLSNHYSKYTEYVPLLKAKRRGTNPRIWVSEFLLWCVDRLLFSAMSRVNLEPSWEWLETSDPCQKRRQKTGWSWTETSRAGLDLTEWRQSIRAAETGKRKEKEEQLAWGLYRFTDASNRQAEMLENSFQDTFPFTLL